MPRTALLALASAVVGMWGIPACAERPVALILSGDGAFRNSAADSRWALIETGVEVYAGDSVDARGTDLKVAFCPATSDSAGRVLLVRKGTVVRFQADAIDARPSAPDSAPIPICVFPDLSGNYFAGTWNFTDNAAQPAPNLETAQQRSLDLASSMASDPERSLVSRMTRAALLERFNHPLEAMDEYRQIRRLEPRATWTRERIAVLGTNSLPSATTSPTSSGVLEPRTRPAEAPGVTDVEPDFSKGEKYALLIGISDYPEGKGVSKLKFAATDALTFADYLSKDRGGKMDPTHVWTLTDGKATRDAIEQALTTFVQGKGGTLNTLVVFVAAHGRYVCLDRSPDSAEKCSGKEEPFIVTPDGDTEAPNISGYSMRRLRELVTKRAADFGRVLVFVDVCHGGNVTWKGADLSLAPKDVIDALNAAGSRLGIMSASAIAKNGDRAREYAYESPDLKHGVFTYYLLRAMNGDAPPIHNEIVFSTLASTVRLNVQAFTKDVAQTPIASEDHTNEMLPVVDNASLPPYKLEQVTTASAQLERKGEPPTPEEKRFQEQLDAGCLLEPGGAGDMLRAIAARFSKQSPVYQASRDRYRVALEDRGQRTILRHLQGDQNPVAKSEFEACADLFGAALELAPDADFDESRMLFCKGRALLFPDPDRPYGSTVKDAEFGEGVKLLERSIRIDPLRSYSYNAIGIGYLEKAQYDDATQALRTAIRFAPYWAYPRHNLALALTQQGRYNDAIATYRVAMLAGPNYSYLPYNLGLLYQQLAESGRAKDYYRQAETVAEARCTRRGLAELAACPERAAPRTALASLEAAKGKRKKAEGLYLAALSDSPDDLTANHDLAALLSAWEGRQAEAEQRWQQNLACSPRHLPSLIGYADLLSRECRFGDALPLFQRIHAEMPEYGPAQIGLARSLIAANRLSEAKAVVDSLVATRASNYDVRAVQAEYLRSAGQDANSAWQEALRLAPSASARKQIKTRRDRTGCPSK